MKRDYPFIHQKLVGTATILAPLEIDNCNLNNCSIVLKVEFEEFAFLFTGDAEKKLELDIIFSDFDIFANVLKIAHHGSRTSTHHNFLERVSPDIVVISVGENNCYGHPAQETLDKLKDIDVYRTDEHGDIIISIIDGELHVDTYKDEIIKADSTTSTLTPQVNVSLEYLSNKNTNIFMFHHVLLYQPNIIALFLIVMRKLQMQDIDLANEVKLHLFLRNFINS